MNLLFLVRLHPNFSRYHQLPESWSIYSSSQLRTPQQAALKTPSYSYDSWQPTAGKPCKNATRCMYPQRASVFSVEPVSQIASSLISDTTNTRKQ